MHSLILDRIKKETKVCLWGPNVNKAELEQNFQGKKIRVLLMHYSNGVGLNLTQATLVIALDIAWMCMFEILFF